jgi:hypothetical protein
MLDFGARWRWSASRPGPLYPRGNSPLYPLDTRLGRHQSRSGRCGEEKSGLMVTLKYIFYSTATFGKTVSQFSYGNLRKEELGRIIARTN